MSIYPKFRQALQYLRYYVMAANGSGHGMHSPFVFDFIMTVLNDQQPYPVYEMVEKLRQQLLHDKRVLPVVDFGAGSAMDKSGQRSIASIAKNAAKPGKYGQLLYRMVKKYKPATILELGTSLGITSSYLSLAMPEIKVLTLEGSPAIAEVARQNFKKLNLQGIELVEGNFNETLLPVLASLSTVDFVFIDGNHRREPTLGYFQQLLEKINPHTVLVFDDIHWSPDMEAAWETICANNAVRCSLDLFFIGIVFFRDEFKEKQHFTIRF